ncbi:STAS domain-containing protein [Kitasatospora sp. NPDC051914]|uniref:STAS domain-containing protein n=1 Tax=Kitasatospora sp. NPDC051914 TaxID=3154945 RepID=UPI003441D17D
MERLKQPGTASDSGGAVVVGASGPLDVLQAREIGAAARDRVGGGAVGVVLDLTGATFADEIGVLTLAEEVLALTAAGLPVALCGMQPHLEERLHRAGVSRRAAVCDTLADAHRLVAAAAEA